MARFLCIATFLTGNIPHLTFKTFINTTERCSVSSWTVLKTAGSLLCSAHSHHSWQFLSSQLWQLQKCQSVWPDATTEHLRVAHQNQKPSWIQGIMLFCHSFTGWYGKEQRSRLLIHFDFLYYIFDMSSTVSVYRCFRQVIVLKIGCNHKLYLFIYQINRWKTVSALKFIVVVLLLKKTNIQLILKEQIYCKE